MKTINFLKEPGYTYDLFFAFSLCFNREEIMKHNISPEDEEYYGRLRDEFMPVSQELLLFFYLVEGNRMFMSEKYFEPYKESFIQNKYNLSVVLAALADYNKVIENILKFYFKDAPAEALEKGCNSLQMVNELIKESRYPSNVKNALYAFFIDPIPVIQKLIYELMSKEIKLAGQYEKEYSRLQSIQETFHYDLFAEKAKQMREQPIDLTGFEVIYVSFCLNCRHILYWKFYEDAVFLQLGVDYSQILNFLIKKTVFPALDLFGTVVSEKNRIEILNLMHRNGEVTIKDIEQELGFTGTNSYYHLSLMMKAGMLNTRNQGRTVLYRIDQAYFESLIESIKKYTK